MSTITKVATLLACLALLSCTDNSRRFALVALFGDGVMGAPVASGGTGNPFCSAIFGASLVAQDGTFLGKMTSELDQSSILNELGPHGNEFSSVSIWNEFGNYGSEFGEYSAFNEFADSPPLILINGQVAGQLSVSQTNPSAVHPYALKQCRY